MRSLIPDNIPTDAQQAIKQLDRRVRQTESPLLRDKKSVNAIKEGTSAYHLESDGLYRYTKINKTLYKEKVGIEEAPAAPVPVVEDSSNAEVLREVSYTADEPRTILLDYTRESDSPEALSFSMAWYRLSDTQELEALSESEQPTDISFSPETPSSEAGKHYVSVSFTPGAYVEGDRIIGRVIIEESE